jgi:hypothetical protein
MTTQRVPYASFLLVPVKREIHFRCYVELIFVSEGPCLRFCTAREVHQPLPLELCANDSIAFFRVQISIVPLEAHWEFKKSLIGDLLSLFSKTPR